MFSAGYSIPQGLLPSWPSVGQDHHQILPSRSPLPALYSAVPAGTRHKKYLEKSKKYCAPDFKSFGATSTTWEKWEC